MLTNNNLIFDRCKEFLITRYLFLYRASKSCQEIQSSFHINNNVNQFITYLRKPKGMKILTNKRCVYLQIYFLF